jgi:branched-chain amino acid transport system substrate-binding protein
LEWGGPMFQQRVWRIGLSSALLAVVLPLAVSSGAGAAKATGTPIAIGSIETESSPATAGTSTEGVDTLNAWVKTTNAAGGIDGHPIKVYILDDKDDPAVGLSEAKTLVQNDHVIAIVGQTSETDESWSAYAQQEKIPVIGGTQIDTTWFTNPMFYPVGGSVISNIWGQMKSAAVQGVKKIGVILCTETPACAQAQPLFKSEASSVGMTVVYDALASQTQPSYTAECLAAKQAGVQAMAAYVNDVVLARDCARQGFKPKWIDADEGPTISLIKQYPELANTVGSSEHWNCLAAPTPATQPFYTAMKKYAPQWLIGGKDYDSSANTDCSTWDSAEAFTLAVQKANVPKSAKVTSADVIRGLSQFKNTTAGPYSPPMTYSDGTKANPQALCDYLYKYKGTTLINVPGPNKYTCQPAS